MSDCGRFRKTVDPKCDSQPRCKWVVNKGCVPKERPPEPERRSDEPRIIIENGIVKLKDEYYMGGFYEELNGDRYYVVRNSQELSDIIKHRNDILVSLSSDGRNPLNYLVTTLVDSMEQLFKNWNKIGRAHV